MQGLHPRESRAGPVRNRWTYDTEHRRMFCHYSPLAHAAAGPLVCLHISCLLHPVLGAGAGIPTPILRKKHSTLRALDVYFLNSRDFSPTARRSDFLRRRPRVCILVLQLLWLQLSQIKWIKVSIVKRIRLKQRHLHRMKNLTCTSIQTT